MAGYTRSDMSPAPAPQEPRSAPFSERVAFPPIFRFLSAAYILSFFALFSYSGLFAPLNFDDGTAVVANLEHFDVPMWRNFLRILTVFTTAYRPLATLFWRPMYAVFGFNPLPYRIAVHLLLVANIALAYLLARRLKLSREAALLSTLVFCYNVATADLYYDTCTVTDVICFMFYALSLLAYVRWRDSGDPLRLRMLAWVS